MKKQRKQKKLLALAAILALVSLIAGTFAWVTAQDQRVNRMESAAVSDGSVSVTEKFQPGPIQPGGSTVKEVSVTNAGNQKVYVRVSYEEYLKALTGKGVQTQKTTPFDPATLNDVTKKAGIGVDWPVNTTVTITVPNTTYYGYNDITSKVEGLPAGVKVIADGVYTKDAATGVITDTTKYAAYYPYILNENTYYQKMDISLAIKERSFDTPVTDWKFTYTDASAKYYVYEGGFNLTLKNWGTSVLTAKDKSTGPTAPTGSALLGYQGDRYETKYDYRNVTDGGIIKDADLTAAVAAVKGATNTATAKQYPTAANDETHIQADSALGGYITLKYGADIVEPTTAAITAGEQWVYNPEDGWFYYLQAVDSGKRTKDLLKNVNYDAKIKDEYANATYDLGVKMEAMQYSDAALTADDGFGLKTDATANPISAAIFNALKQAK